jgi:acyl-CoA synthetase (AMP-forming)/AMP-acid ligase II
MDNPCEFLLDRFKEAGDGVAFIDDDEAFTYRWILEETPKYEEYLDRTGVQSGDVIVVAADYSPQMFCFILAAISRGLTIAPMTRDSMIEKSTILQVSECQWFIEFSTDIAEIGVERRKQVPTNECLAEFLSRGSAGLILFTSGSSGTPKGILLDFASVLEKFKASRPPVVAITFLMLDHFGGINTLFHILSNLGTIVTVKNRSVATISEAIQNHHVELLPTTPSFLNMFVHSGAHTHYDLGSLTTISFGTEVMPEATVERLRRIFPDVKLQQTYGLSELGVLRSKSRADGTLWFRIGGEGFQTKVVDGILWIKSEYAMVCYLNAPSPFDSDGWFNTQDRVEFDGEYVKILGRTTDVINVGGQKVYPSEIENVIIGLENIEDVAVLGEANALLGNIVVAHIVLKLPEDEANLRKRIRKSCAETLASYKVPSKVVIATSSLYTNRLKKIRR